MKRAIAWFARNGVAANLLLMVIIVGGLLSLIHMKKEIFPTISTDMINISVIYRGASPEEVEEGICMRIEEALQGLNGIDRIQSIAQEGMGVVIVEVTPGVDVRSVLNDVKAQVDAISTFPEESEKPIVREVLPRRQIIGVALYGEVDERTLRTLGEEVRDEITQLPGITSAELIARSFEISIEVSEEALRRYGLTFDEVAWAVRNYSVNIPAGSIKSEAGEYLIRVQGQAYYAQEFARIPLRSLPDGSRLFLGDVAKVVDGFEDVVFETRLNGKPSVMILVYQFGQQDALQIAQEVKTYVKQLRQRLPQGVSAEIFADYSQFLRDRLSLLLKNAAYGFVLVFVLLGLFLRLRLAIWVSIGIPVSFLGALWMMPGLDVTINMLTLFAFLLVLGIVVDDAIVVGENVYTHFQLGEEGVEAAIKGTQEVATPVMFSVMTTVAAFVPLLSVEGNFGKALKQIPLVVIPTLLFSLTEAMLCVPNHLSHFRRGKNSNTIGFHPFHLLQQKFQKFLQWFLRGPFQRVLNLCLEYRYFTFSVALSTILIAIGLFWGGIIKFQFFPPAEGDNAVADVTLPEGAPDSLVRAAVRQIEQAALRLQKKLLEQNEGKPLTTDGSPLFRHITTTIGNQPYRNAVEKGPTGSRRNFKQPNVGEVWIELAPAEVRKISAQEIVDLWRKETGPVSGAIELIFTSSLLSAGEPINIQLSGPDLDDLKATANELKAALARYEGVMDIADSFREGKKELKIHIKPEGETLGLTLAMLGHQIRQAFYGEEAQRVQRGRNEVRVMVRYPKDLRDNLQALQEMWIRLPDGTQAPFTAVAEADIGRGYSTIRRVDRRRTINVTADLDFSRVTTDEILNQLQKHDLPKILARHPRIRYSFEGQSREQRRSVRSLARGFVIAIFAIYALIAIPLRSYVHPMIIMTSIPFAFVGALLGHLLLGLDLTFLSLFGCVALAGVAVNDGLVLVDFINRARRSGVEMGRAVREAALRRFRPVLLTSLTTFAGVMPLIAEKSVQARFLIPMAVSLGFGVLYCTLTTLLLVPACYLILEDLRGLLQRWWGISLEPHWGEELEGSPLWIEETLEAE